ncbi:MAG TPA: hypothetical protein VGF13_02800 [Verrucomicrobiae bacterium]|jgi:hypothetical protein
MNGLRLVLALAFAAVRVRGQSTRPAKLEAPAAPPQTTNAQSIAAVPRAEELVLTGIADIASYKRAFLQIDSPGQPPQFHTLAEGEQRGDITLVAIDSQKAKVTLRYRGLVRELSLNARTSGAPAPSAMELQRDASHSAHHAKRAQSDRENDERAAREETHSDR